jgi:putative hydrolase of the HAD superfamily
MTTGADRLILWDFDGTLARREGLWSGCMREVLDEHEPGHGIAVEQIRAAMHQGYPWSTPHEPHLHLCEPDPWWEAMEARMAQALGEVGIAAERRAALARAARRRLTDPTIGWSVFEDSRPALAATAAAGWRNAILSNHIPELATIVGALGLGDSLDAVFSSAVTGYEKPHPEAFRLALRALGEPGTVWMVGDNPQADVAGAEALGIPAVLVAREGDGRARDAEVARRTDDLIGAARLIIGSR